MGGFFQNRSYYQFTNGFTTRTATNDGTGSALASFLLGLPAVKQRQEGIPQMQLRQWYADAFVQDSFQLTGQPVFDDNSRNADRWFNTAAFATPGGVHVRQHRPEHCLWTRQTTVDLALQREFSITETVKVQVRAEVFNALNHTNLGTPNRFVNTPQFGTI